MLKGPAIRQATRALARPSPVSAYRQTRLLPAASLSSPVRFISNSKKLHDPEYDEATTSHPAGASGEHEGQFARTSEAVRFDYPDERDHPRSHVVQGRGGAHDKRTLASFSMEDKVACVTGGARGLGLVMTQALVNSGADVAIVDMNKDEAERQAGMLTKTFQEENPDVEKMPKITSHFCDVSSPTSIKQAFGDVIKSHGQVDSLVTSAGFTENYDAISYPHDRMQKLWSVNVEGTYFFAVEAAKHFMSRDAPGSIVCIGSMSGAIVNVPQPQAPYNAAKAAVRHLVSSLAVEWAHANVRVNCISPGYMLTALTKKILDENPELHRHWTSLIPVGKMGRPEDLMGAVVFLASEASQYMTGADLRVDGGYTCT